MLDAQPKPRVTEETDSGRAHDKTVLYFISKNSSWQKYRNDILRRLAQRFDLSVRVLTTGNIKGYIREDSFVKVDSLKSWLPLSWKV